MTEELEDLETLVKSPGWQRVERFVTAEWSAQMEQHVELAAGQTDDLGALQRLRQVIAARRAIQRVMGWPKERMAALRGNAQKAQTPQGYTRGGM